MIEIPSVGNVIIEEVEKCEGEARANNRKGKLIFFYEWNITLKWKGECEQLVKAALLCNRCRRPR